MEAGPAAIPLPPKGNARSGLRPAHSKIPVYSPAGKGPRTGVTGASTGCGFPSAPASGLFTPSSYPVILTGNRRPSSRRSYGTATSFFAFGQGEDSNLQPPAYEAGKLPTALPYQVARLFRPANQVCC